MKKISMVVMGLAVSLISLSQTIQGSLQKGAASNQVDVIFLPDHSSAGAAVNYLSISIAIPLTSYSASLNPTIAGAGLFSGITFSQASPFNYTSGTERIYSWVYNSGSGTGWTSGDDFVGATITFNGGFPPTKIRLVDFTNATPTSGGDNSNTFFLVITNTVPFDRTNYANFFYAIPGVNGSTTGTYGNGDQFAETTSLISLPVNLLNFSGYKNGTKNALRWTTASESNSLGFEVQRSLDGVNYSSIGFVNSKAPGGNSTSNLSYTFDDNSPVGKKQYYRLLQQDMDGGGKLSNTVVISGGKPLSLAIGGLFPNPAKTQISVIIDAPEREDLTLMITDISGKTVKQQIVNVEIGSNTVPVDISNLAQGSYLVRAVCKSSDCGMAVGKFNKQL